MTEFSGGGSCARLERIQSGKGPFMKTFAVDRKFASHWGTGFNFG